jgi:hypothetical protein
MAPPPTLQELIEIVRQDASSDQPLDQLIAASAAAAQLQETTDALLDRCRRDGRSWTEISSALGVTKQAVHKRFASAMAAHLVAATPLPTFERFTDRARHVVAQSRQVTIDLGAPEVGPEHILLALFAEPAGLAGRALTAMDVSAESVRAAIRAQATGGKTAAASTSDSPPYSDEGKRALRDALAVALEFSHNYIGTEHLLLGLYRDEENAAARILIESGALEATARAHVVDMLRGLGDAP